MANAMNRAQLVLASGLAPQDFTHSDRHVSTSAPSGLTVSILTLISSFCHPPLGGLWDGYQQRFSSVWFARAERLLLVGCRPIGEVL